MKAIYRFNHLMKKLLILILLYNASLLHSNPQSQPAKFPAITGAEQKGSVIIMDTLNAIHHTNH